MNLGFIRRKLSEYSAELQRVFAQRGSRPVIARRRGVSLVENQIDDFENRCESRLELSAAGNLEGNVSIRESPLRSYDSLRNRRLSHKKRACNLIRRQTAK